MNHRISPLQAHSFPARPAPAGNEPRWAIEEVTARADVSERLVRYCDVQGLLGSAKRTGATGRRYTPTTSPYYALSGEPMFWDSA